MMCSNPHTNARHSSSFRYSSITRIRELHGLLQDGGDTALVMQGIFHNYPTVGYVDPTFGKTVECAEWLAYADLLESRIAADVEFALGQYVPYAAVAIHHLTARPRKVQLESPSMYYHQYLEHARNLGVARLFLNPNALVVGSSLTATICDVLPHVIEILHPTMKQSNPQMMNGSEKRELSNLVDTMLSLSITYRAEASNPFLAHAQAAPWQRGGGGSDNISVVYKLDPPIELLSEWSDPLDESTSKRFEARDKYGNPIVKKRAFIPFAPRGSSLFPPPAETAYKVDRRDQAMPSKMKLLLVRECEYELLRRSENKIIEEEKKSLQKVLDGQRAGEIFHIAPMRRGCRECACMSALLTCIAAAVLLRSCICRGESQARCRITGSHVSSARLEYGRCSARHRG
jgi:hypothetical protein